MKGTKNKYMGSQHTSGIIRWKANMTVENGGPGYVEEVKTDWGEGHHTCKIERFWVGKDTAAKLK